MATTSKNRPDIAHLLTAFALLSLVPSSSHEVAAPSNDKADGHTSAPPRPKASVWMILKDTARAFSDDRTLAVSAGTTFYALLALFPALAAFVSIYGLFADSGDIAKQLELLSGLLPAGAVDIIREQVARLTAKGSTALGGAFLIGLGTSVWSAGAGIKAMFDALNIAYGLKERRGFFSLNAVALLFTLGFLITVALAAILLVALPPLLERFAGHWTEIVFSVARWPFLAVVLTVMIALLYRFGPSPQERKWRWLTPGSVFAALAWCVVSTAFSYYAANFGSYNATYGSLGAVIGLMTWIWLSVAVILLGAELNAQVDRSTDVKRDDPR